MLATPTWGRASFLSSTPQGTSMAWAPPLLACAVSVALYRFGFAASLAWGCT
jgi:hypothetical protein